MLWWLVVLGKDLCDWCAFEAQWLALSKLRGRKLSSSMDVAASIALDTPALWRRHVSLLEPKVRSLRSRGANVFR